MGTPGLLSLWLVVGALLLVMVPYYVQGNKANCTETCDKYRITDMAFTFSCTDISDETERLDCQKNCKECTNICDNSMVEKVYNCPDIYGKMEEAHGGKGRSLNDPLAVYGDEDTSLMSTVPTSQGRSITASDDTVESRGNEAPETEPGAQNSKILIWIALCFVLCIVIVGGVVMVCVLFVPRRRNRNNNRRDPEVDSVNGVRQGVTSYQDEDQDQSVYYPVIPPGTQVVLRPSEQY